MPEITYQDDQTGAIAKVKGSDGRSNVSSRSDSRGYYNSRDVGQAYALTFSHTASANTEYTFYLQNTSTDGKQMVISAVGVNSDLGALVELNFVTGTLVGGTAITPVNMNKAVSNAAAAVGSNHANSTAISGISDDGTIDHLLIGTDGHEEFRLDDRLRLGQNDAIALKVETVTSGTPLIKGVIFFYFE